MWLKETTYLKTKRTQYSLRLRVQQQINKVDLIKILVLIRKIKVMRPIKTIKINWNQWS
jgi:hypothetical protein